MREFWKKTLIMAAIGFAAGILVGLGFLLPHGVGAYYAEYGAGWIALHLGMSGLLGAVNMGSTTIYDLERWGLLRCTLTHFLIAMSCLYSSMLSMTLINYKMANLSAVGKRSTVSPASRLAGLTGTLAASFLVQVIGLALLFSLLIFAFLVDFGDHLGHVVLLSLTGSAAGLALGIAVSVLFKVGENMKITILISLTMAGCFFAGMMGIETKYVIDTTVPALNLVNPVAMITDGLYALYYYDTFERFFFDLISIGIFTVIMLAVSLVGLRRQSYDHF